MPCKQDKCGSEIITFSTVERERENGVRMDARRKR